MAPRHPPAYLVPLVAFLLTGGAAAWIAGAAADDPATAALRRATAYMSVLADGNAAAARGFHAPAALRRCAWDEDRRAHALAGTHPRLGPRDVLEGGLMVAVTAAAFRDERLAWQEAQLWIRAPDGAWRLADVNPLWPAFE